MPYQKEQLKYSAASAIIGSLLCLLIEQIFTALNFSFYLVPSNLSISLSVFLGVFLVLSIITKIKNPSFSLILPIFLIYFAILFTIALIRSVIAYNASFPQYYTLQELLLGWLEHGAPYLAVFSLIGITAGIIMVRLTSKLKYDAFYFIFSTLIGVGAGTVLIKLSWEIKYAVSYSPLYPYLSIFTLIGTLMAITIIQIAWLRKQQPSNIHTCISIAFWIIAFITTIFLYEWLTYVQPPWF
jgi:hypothetical protein